MQEAASEASAESESSSDAPCLQRLDRITEEARKRREAINQGKRIISMPSNTVEPLLEGGFATTPDYQTLTKYQQPKVSPLLSFPSPACFIPRDPQFFGV